MDLKTSLLNLRVWLPVAKNVFLREGNRNIISDNLICKTEALYELVNEEIDKLESEGIINFEIPPEEN